MQWFKEVGFVDIAETAVPGGDSGFCATRFRPSNQHANRGSLERKVVEN